MKKFLIGLFMTLPMIAHANTEYLGGSKQSQQYSLTLVNASESTSLIVKHSPVTNVAQEANLIVSNATLVPNISSNDLQNAVPLPVAAPLLALAIALFGFGANRRRV